MNEKWGTGGLSFSSCTSHLHFSNMAARLNVRNGLRSTSWASWVTSCQGLEPYHLGYNYNFNFITIKAMTSFVAFKEKHSKSESPVALQSSAEPSCCVYTLWASSPEAPAHLMWFPVPEQEQAMSTVSVRVWVKGNISVLTNMHNSACCQEKPQEIHSLRKKKKSKFQHWVAASPPSNSLPPSSGTTGHWYAPRRACIAF